MRPAKTLIRLRRCAAWSESSLVAQAYCKFCMRWLFISIISRNVCFTLRNKEFKCTSHFWFTRWFTRLTLYILLHKVRITGAFLLLAGLCRSLSDYTFVIITRKRFLLSVFASISICTTIFVQLYIQFIMQVKAVESAYQTGLGPATVVSTSPRHYRVMATAKRPCHDFVIYKDFAWWFWK